LPRLGSSGGYLLSSAADGKREEGSEEILADSSNADEEACVEMSSK